MELALMIPLPEEKNIQRSDELLKLVSKFWSKSQWELYLKQLEGTQPKEELYVGTTSDLEKFVAKRSEFGTVPPSTVEFQCKGDGEIDENSTDSVKKIY